MAVLDDLLEYILDGAPSALYPELEGWLKSSRRFRAFAVSHRSKLRAKVRNVRDEAGLQDLRAELETAVLLLRAERFTLEYENYAASKQRGPDFTVTFKTHTLFNVEVRRLRGLELDAGDADARAGKLMGVLCEKLGQLPPGIINLLWLTSRSEIPPADVTRAATTLRQLADLKVEQFFTRRGLASAADFAKRYPRLSGVVLHRPGETVLWLNPLARRPVPPEIATALRRLEAE